MEELVDLSPETRSGYIGSGEGYHQRKNLRVRSSECVRSMGVGCGGENRHHIGHVALDEQNIAGAPKQTINMFPGFVVGLYLLK